LPTETVVSTVEPTAAQTFFWTEPSVEDQANQIDADMREIEQKLKSQDINIKP
jgi:hypothetical protein